MSKNLFLRVYELRKTFHYLIKKAPKGKNVIQGNPLVFVEMRFNGFRLVRRMAENELRQLYRPMDIVYRPVSCINQIMNCYFSKSMRNAYRVLTEKKQVLNQQLQIRTMHVRNLSLRRNLYWGTWKAVVRCQGSFTNLKIKIYRLSLTMLNSWGMCRFQSTLILDHLWQKNLQFWRGCHALPSLLCICGCILFEPQPR